MRKWCAPVLVTLVAAVGCGGSSSTSTATRTTRTPTRTPRTALATSAPTRTPPTQVQAEPEPKPDVKLRVAEANKKRIEDSRRLKVMVFTTRLRSGQTPRERVAAAEELARLHDTYATTHLMTRIADDQDPAVRSACVQTLGSLEDESSIPLLVTLLEDEDLRLAESALKALSAITHREYAFSEGTTIKARKKTAKKWIAWLEARKTE